MQVVTHVSGLIKAEFRLAQLGDKPAYGVLELALPSGDELVFFTRAGDEPLIRQFAAIAAACVAPNG